MRSTVALLASLALVAPAFAALKDVAPYPDAEAGYVRYVIHLPEQPDESAFKVEVLPGKTLSTDCNNQRFTGTLAEKTLQGWGYSFYRLEGVQGPLATLMACPNGKQSLSFVQVKGEGFLLRYNSKLPIVVYVPQGIEVRYRVWSAGPQMKDASKE
ncbi:MAG: serine protease inhibitor ecotin [Pseudomonas sp.]|uniref:serine protease inhibitor ecotin n=1 Tax=Pseudomonas abieticivorans TaxID=2931382 RepID=UPI0020BF1336|nr:serine protease inhibitor ecotin [Pseudomonas sp. PIA16]MDE1166540.1 serine protease inhibitor ecotin [Pseudomonas sp.]